MMLGHATRVYVYQGPVDMRKQIDGLSLLAQEISAEPLSGAVFVFFNRQRDKVKLLWWDRHGFWVAYKRLERGRFRVPKLSELDYASLLLALEGVDLSVRRLGAVKAKKVA